VLVAHAPHECHHLGIYQLLAHQHQQPLTLWVAEVLADARPDLMTC